MNKLILGMTSALLMSSLQVNANSNLKKNIGEQLKTDKASVVGQKKISKLAEESKDVLMKYRQTLKKIQNAKIYNNQLEKIINKQLLEMDSVAKQMGSIQETSKGIVPLMLRMVETMESFVSLDLPFLKEERAKRISSLKKLMDRADVSVSEKYRRILEAYQVENEYGRTIEAYRGSQEREGNALTVDFLRIGRIALVYQTLDGGVTSVWNQKVGKWQDLGSEYRKSIQEGLRMARKQSAPNLLKLPIFKTGMN